MADSDVTGGECCDPQARQEAGHHAATCTSWWGYHEDRRIARSVACPEPRGCGQVAGQHCVTGSGYRRGAHQVRVVVARGGQPAPINKAGRPSDTQGRILGAAMYNQGVYRLPGYNFSGVPPLRRAMRAMETKGWFRFVQSDSAEDVYEITDDGCAAWQRYEPWRHGERKR